MNQFSSTTEIPPELHGKVFPMFYRWTIRIMNIFHLFRLHRINVQRLQDFQQKKVVGDCWYSLLCSCVLLEEDCLPLQVHSAEDLLDVVPRPIYLLTIETTEKWDHIICSNWHEITFKGYSSWLIATVSSESFKNRGHTSKKLILTFCKKTFIFLFLHLLSQTMQKDLSCLIPEVWTKMRKFS